MSRKDPVEIAFSATKFEKALVEQLKAEGLDPTHRADWLASEVNAEIAKLEAGTDDDELVFSVIDNVQTSLDSYIAQNEAVTKKLFDKVRELEDRISYLEVGRN
jgi:phosphoglycolate phosphatase-like HAD superfamily hydrolase